MLAGGTIPPEDVHRGDAVVNRPPAHCGGKCAHDWSGLVGGGDNVVVGRCRDPGLLHATWLCAGHWTFAAGRCRDRLECAVVTPCGCVRRISAKLIVERLHAVEEASDCMRPALGSTRQQECPHITLLGQGDNSKHPPFLAPCPANVPARQQGTVAAAFSAEGAAGLPAAEKCRLESLRVASGIACR